jgi:hypothetical protein
VKLLGIRFHEYLLDCCQVVSGEQIGVSDEANRYIFASFNCEGPIDSFIRLSEKSCAV